MSRLYFVRGALWGVDWETGLLYPLNVVRAAAPRAQGGPELMGEHT
jgi:hypothetical protein